MKILCQAKASVPFTPLPRYASEVLNFSSPPPPLSSSSNSSKSSSSSSWTCTVCTFMNSNGSRCEMCNSKKPAASPSTPSVVVVDASPVKRSPMPLHVTSASKGVKEKVRRRVGAKDCWSEATANWLERSDSSAEEQSDDRTTFLQLLAHTASLLEIPSARRFAPRTYHLLA